MLNNVLTASRMSCAMRCLRQHYWQFEVGLRKQAVGFALRFGSAWARGMEARWNGHDFDNALAFAIPEGVELDGYACATLASLLAGYYDYWGEREELGKLNPEVRFKRDIGLGFTAEGKLDGLGSMRDGRSAIVEGKTTGDSLAPDSDYWLRLDFNLQVQQYVVESRAEGWEVVAVCYDVTRKPSIRPKQVDNLDDEGRVIVVDGEGKRVYVTKGKNAGQPRSSGDKEKGYVVKSHFETPDEFSDRLWRDTLKRPSFYFARREVAVVDDMLATFERQRMAIAKMILALRENETGLRDPSDAWPRNVSENTCNFCSYKSFCLQNLSVNPERPPEGFSVQPFNPELYDTDTASSETPAVSAE